ncbi:hypothetical protein B0H67DRAFT_640251 [Lasiosphaeris hirsuta]|uniref:Heterokaryon incompatibility domain-containing protein n=1 Tax=Lasiosphaeris hirsuta TaxID=260670 RepID=A0AA40BD11_9PEZI|nr:hypothetical protein B0H67DRAFT_640251 [Lasiosphaeris hirsuta]
MIYQYITCQTKIHQLYRCCLMRDDDIPRYGGYATLSHTWGDDGVILQEMRRMESKIPQALNKQKQHIADKRGFTKIESAAAMAVRRGLGYLWVGTCCIQECSPDH